VRVCLVSRPTPLPHGDGHGRYVWEASAALAAAGHEVHLLTAPTGEGGAAPTAPAGVRVHTVDIDSGPAAIPQAYPTPKLRHAMAVYTALLHLHEEHRFDLIELPLADGEGYFAFRGKRMLGQFAGAVMAVRLCTPAADRRRENGETLFDGEAAFTDHMETASMREADLITSPTQALLDLVAQRVETDPAWPTPARAVVPPPLSPAPLPRRPAPATPPTVLFPFALEERRGPRLFVEAARRLLTVEPEARFRLTGEDTNTAPVGRSMLEAIRSRHGALPEERVCFERGKRPLGADDLDAAAVVCLPGVDHEPTYLILDAAARGVPVVLAESPLRELLPEAPGVRYVPPGDDEALARAIGAALADGRGERDLSAFAPAAFAGRLLAAVADAAGRTAAAAPAVASDGAPELSVIVPVYNLGRYLPETLASIDAQTYRGFELIIVDDGSTDPETIALLDRLRAEGRRVIRKPNGGLGSARNAGIAAATGRWVASIDADDLIAPEYFERALAVLRANPSLGYACALVRCFETDPAVITAGWIPLGMAGFDRDLLLCFNIGGIAGSIFDRRAVLEVGGYDETLPGYQDWDLWCRLAHRGVRGGIIPEFLFYYRVRPDSMYHGGSLARHDHQKSYLIDRHAGGPLLSNRTLRLQFAEAAAAKAALRIAQEEAASASAAAREALAAREESARRTAEAEAGAAQAWRHAGDLEAMLKTAAADLKAAQERAQALAAQLDSEQAAARARAAELETRAEELAAALARESAERARLEARLEAATNQTLLTGDRLSRALADLAAAEQALAALRDQVAAHDCAVHTRRVLEENIRYRMADRLNSAIRGTGVHSIAKALARRAIDGRAPGRDAAQG